MAEFSIRTVDLAQILSAVERLLKAINESNQWIGSHGHQSIPMAEGLYDAVDTAVDGLRNEVENLRYQYENSSPVQTGVFVLMESLGEVEERVFAALCAPNDPTIRDSNPLFIRLSVDAAPVVFDKLIIDQLSFARDNLQAWISETQGDSQSPVRKSENAAGRPKRLAPGDARAFAEAAFLKHHNYESSDGTPIICDPIGTRELSRLASDGAGKKISEATASTFFTNAFGGRPAYEVTCRDSGRLLVRLQAVSNGKCRDRTNSNTELVAAAKSD